VDIHARCMQTGYRVKIRWGWPLHRLFSKRAASVQISGQNGTYRAAINASRIQRRMHRSQYLSAWIWRNPCG